MPDFATPTAGGEESKEGRITFVAVRRAGDHKTVAEAPPTRRASIRPYWMTSTGLPNAAAIGSQPSPGASGARIRPFSRLGAPRAMSLVP
jgi:hypothetical protein